MKKLLLIITLITLFAKTVSTSAQGVIKFGNDSLNRIYDSYGRPVFGVSGYRFGLYMGAAGSTDSQLVLIATTVNSPATSSTSPIAGVFNGGNPFTLPAGYAAGTTYAFQIRGWSYAAGTSYEQAISSGDATLDAGVSAVGFVIPVTPPATTPALFGTGAGQISGFTFPIIPEPGTLAVGGAGAATLLFFRRRK